MKKSNYCLVILTILLFGANSTFAQNLLFNEVMSSNQQFLQDEDNDSPDWIELYNAGNSTINISEYGLSDNNNPTDSWTFPDFGLKAGQYVMVFASGKDRKDFPLYWNTIITEGDTWRYHVPEIEPPANWNELNYNDASWKIGPSGFGYGDNDDNTVLNNIRSVFIRKIFSIADVSAVEEAILHMDYDDAFVAYLNGTEIARANITSNGAPVFDALANNDSHEARMYTGGVPDKFEISNIRSLLNEGNNVLAIQVHNGTRTSSDLTAIPFLTLGHSTFVDGDVAPFISVGETKFHTNFKISSEGETLYLFKNNNLVDSLTVPELGSNISYGRNSTQDDTWYYFDEPTPGSNNNTTAYTGFSGDVTFSVPGGIYSTAQHVSLSSENASDNIYFTTDNTEPTTSDRKYTGSVLVTATTMLRARVINPGELPGHVATQSYFYGIEHDVPVISLVSNPDNFFGYENGIYIQGPPKPSSGENCDNGANYWQDWEVPVHVSMIEADGNLAFEQNAGVKIFGGCSRNNPQKSLSLRFRKQYGKEGLDYKVFDNLDIERFYSLNLRSSGNDWNQTMFRDGLQMNLFPESVDKMAFRPAVVYINGDYWGIHNIRERIDQYYIASHHNVDPESVNLMEFHVNWLVNLVEGDDRNYRGLLEFIENNDLADPKNYDFVCSQMDVENFALYQAAQICIKNTDWPGNNVKYWQSTDSDMRWRWIAFDLDFGFTDYTHNTLAFALDDSRSSWPNPAQSTFLLRELNKNADFRNLFINAFADELNDLWNEYDLFNLIDEMRADIANEIPLHYGRWGGNVNTWPAKSEGFYSFASRRPNVIRNLVMNHYALKGTYNLNLEVSGEEQGRIKVNTIRPDYYPWDGIYFRYIPITLKAVPKHGYRFVRWEGEFESNNQTVEVTFNKDVTLKAVFEKMEHVGTVVINEIFYNNIEGDSPGDWVEIFNNNPYTVNLSGWKLKDSNDEHEFTFEENTSISPYNYLVVCKDIAQFTRFYTQDKNKVGNMSFGLSSSEDCIRLFNNNNYLIDSLAYYNEQYDSSQAFSYQRFVNDGEISWNNVEGFGTPSSRNDYTTQLDENLSVNRDELQVFPNPFADKLNVQFVLPAPGTVTFKILNQNGAIVFQKDEKYEQSGDHSWEVQETEFIPGGVYFLIVQTKSAVFSRKLIKFQ